MLPVRYQFVGYGILVLEVGAEGDLGFVARSLLVDLQVSNSSALVGLLTGICKLQWTLSRRCWQMWQAPAEQLSTSRHDITKICIEPSGNDRISP